MAKKKPTLEILEAAVEEAAEKMQQLPPANLSLGNTMFNLAVSGKVDVGTGPGRYIWFSGSSSSGKSWLTLAVLAEAARNSAYDNHQLVFFDQERGATFDLAKFFGKKAASRIQMLNVGSLEALYDKLTALMKEGPLVAVLDSFDALTDEAALDKIEEDAKAREANKETAGSYQMAHARIHSSRLRVLVNELADTGSSFIAISQERDAVGATMYEPKTKVSGGRALKYWSSIQVVTSLAGKIEKEIQGKKRLLGHKVRIKVEKNRINGKARDVVLSFVPGFGIDEIGSMLDWLTEEKYLVVSGGRIKSPWYEAAYYREELIKRIEDDNREGELRQFLQESWDDLESKLTITRKARYE